jgi:hypothetical protein
VLCCEEPFRDYGDDMLLITVPAMRPESSLLDRDRAGQGGNAFCPLLSESKVVRLNRL